MMQDSETVPSVSSTSPASSKPVSAAKRKPGKRGAKRKAERRKAKASKRTVKRPRTTGRMATGGRYVLVIHMTEATQKAMDKRIATQQKAKPGERISRSSFARSLVEKALR